MTAAADALADLQSARALAGGASADALAAIDSAIAAVQALMPAPLPVVGPLLTFPHNWSRLMCCTSLSDSSMEYERYAYAQVIRSDTHTLKWRWKAMGSNGAWLLPAFPAYGAEVCRIADYEAGAPVWTDVCPVHYVRTMKENSASYPAKLDLVFPDSLPDGDYFVMPVAYDAAGNRVQGVGDSPVPMPIHLNRHGTPQTHLINYNTTYDWVRRDPYFYVQRVPVELAAKPRQYPRRPRKIEAFSDKPAKGQLHLHYVIPPRKDSVNRPCLTNDGTWVSTCMQGYFFDQLRNIYPQQAVVPGPRGHATAGMFTWLWLGHNGGKYGFAAGGTSLVHILPDDTLIVLAGWEDAIAPYWAQAKTSPWRRQIGDWSAVPDEPHRRCFGSVWGAVPDPRSTRRGKPGNPVIDGLVAHDGDVLFFAFDRYGGGRMLELRWSGRDPNRGKIEKYQVTLPSGQKVDAYRSLAAPPKIREVLPPGSLKDPWGCDWDHDDGLVYVCERGAHGIRKIKPPSGPTEMAEVLDYFIQDPTAAQLGRFEDAGVRYELDSHRRFRCNHGTAKAHSIVAPENIVIKDGYKCWSGLAQSDVRRSKDGVNVEVMCNVPIINDSKCHYLVFDLSDGSWGPEWTVACCNGDNARYTRPYLYTPTTDASGVTRWGYWDWHAYAGAIVAGVGGEQGVGGWTDGAYPIAVRCGGRSIEGEAGARLVWGDFMDGMAEVTLAQPGERTPDLKQQQAGENEYAHTGLRMTYGAAGYSMIDADVPNPSPALAAWLAQSREEA